MTTYRPITRHSNSIERPGCAQCGAKMRLIGIKPERPGYELLSFECPKCHHVQTATGKNDETARPGSRAGKTGVWPGRLIRVGRYRGDPGRVAYIVALPDAAHAIELIRTAVGKLGDEFEDLGRVSEALLVALNLATGQYVKA